MSYKKKKQASLVQRCYYKKEVGTRDSETLKQALRKQ